MLDVLLWLIAVEAAGLVAFPLCYYLLPRLADRGYSVSKPLGILVLGYLSWILSVLHILPAVQATLVALFLILAGISGWSITNGPPGNRSLSRPTNGTPWSVTLPHIRSGANAL